MTTPDDYGYLDDDLETCDRNIAAIEATLHDGPAWLPAMGQADFHAEKEMIKRGAMVGNTERDSGSGKHHGELPRHDRTDAPADTLSEAGTDGDRVQGSPGLSESAGRDLVDLYRESHDYQAFLNSKRITAPPTGIKPGPVNDNLFPFQGDIVRWALRRGRAALYEDCGLGKTIQELSWGKQISDHTDKPVILLAPLAVSHQTLRESQKFDIEAHVTAGEVHRGINITNYEKLKHFNPADFSGIICDESSILKGLDGKLRKHITQFAKQIPYRLLASATPSPNDYMELGSQAEFLDIMSHQEMLATFFTHDGGDTAKWRLKGHAEQDYWKWLASWSVCLQNPADIGYPDDRFKLPPLIFHEHVIESKSTLGYLFPMEARTLQDRQRARKDSVSERVARCAEIVNASNEPWLVWCNLNEEGNLLEKAIANAVQVQGADSPDFKESALLGFANGDIKRMVTKPKIAGFGMNMQVCSNMAFVGLSDSYEQIYQAIRRCWRFGQTKTVNVHIITADTEGAVLRNIKRKEAQAQKMSAAMVEHMRDICAENSGSGLGILILWR